MGTFDRFIARLEGQHAHYDQGRAVTYVAIGDSVTQGVMEADVIDHERVSHQALKRLIHRRYPLAVINVINSGISGDKADRSRARWQRDVVMYQPDLVTISFGANDSRDGEEGLAAYIQAIGDLVDLVRAQTEADVMLLTPSMMMKADNAYIPDCYRELVPEFLETARKGHLELYAQELRKLADEKQVPLVDIYRLWEEMESHGIDIHASMSNGLNHPDRAFHDRIALAMEQAIFSE